MNRSPAAFLLAIALSLLTPRAEGAEPPSVRGKITFTNETVSTTRTTTIVTIEGSFRVPKTTLFRGCSDNPLGVPGKDGAVVTFVGFAGTISYRSEYEDLYVPSEQELADPNDPIHQRTKTKTETAVKTVTNPVDRFDQGVAVDPNTHGMLGCLHFDPLEGKWAFEEGWWNTANNAARPAEVQTTEVTYAGVTRTPKRVQPAFITPGSTHHGTFARASPSLAGSWKSKPEQFEEGAVRTSQVEWSFTLPAEQPRIEVELDRYDTWLPDIGAEGKPRRGLSLTARAVDANGDPWTPGVVRFLLELTGVSREPGTALNGPWSGSANGLDLAFVPERNDGLEVTEEGQRAQTPARNFREIRAHVSPFDSGAYGTLEVSAELFNGERVKARLKSDPQATLILLPKRAQDSIIAASWLAGHGLPENAKAELDDEKVDGHRLSDGDGLTLYEEYRGVWDGKEVVRLKPKEKDLVVENRIGPTVLPGMKLFAEKAKVNVVPVSSLAEDRWVNAGSTRAVTKQHGLRLLIDPTLNEKTGAYADVKDLSGKTSAGTVASPKFCSSVGVVKIAQAPTEAQKPFLEGAIAHEIAHCVGVRHHGYDPLDKLIDLSSDTVLDVDGRNLPSVTVDGKTSTLLAPFDRTQAPKNAIRIGIGRVNGASSGDLGCLMAYRNVYRFVLRRDGVYQQVPIMTEPPPSKLVMCTSGKGTGMNAGGAWFGDATDGLGNCLSRVQIKDAPER